MAYLQFDANNVAPQQPMAAGLYVASISESEVVATKAGTGQMLRLTWDVLDGPMKGRKLFDRINIANQNPKAEEIGQRQLSTLCHAVGVLQLKDTTQLHGRACTLRVAIRKDESGQYGDQNEVKDYRALEGAQRPAPAPAAAAAPAPATPAAPAKAAPPWAANRAA